MSSPDHPEPSIFALHRIPNVLLVLVAVALLLQGPVGAFEALWGYTCNLVRAIFGGEDLLLQVLCQTAPLSLAVSAIIFSFRCGWITLRSPLSVIACSALVLAGTWIGGELRSTVSGETVLVQSEATDSLTVAEVLPASARGETRVWLSDQSLSKMSDGSEGGESESDSDTISVTRAIEILSDFQTVATDGGHHQWNQPVPKVALIPETETLWGSVAKAINQLLGYFVIYRPRLFLAAILLGSYIGWSWQPYFEALCSWARNRLNRPVSASR
jgi:hypothetical protein